MNCDILVGYDDHMSLYRIDQETIELCLRAESNDTVNDLIVDRGTFLKLNSTEGDVFFEVTTADEESFGEFQNALMDFVCDMEEDTRVGRTSERKPASDGTASSKDDRIEELEIALGKLIDVASNCDSWESFPSAPLDEAQAVLEKVYKPHLQTNC